MFLMTSVSSSQNSAFVRKFAFHFIFLLISKDSLFLPQESDVLGLVVLAICATWQVVQYFSLWRLMPDPTGYSLCRFSLRRLSAVSLKKVLLIPIVLFLQQSTNRPPRRFRTSVANFQPSTSWRPWPNYSVKIIHITADMEYSSFTAAPGPSRIAANPSFVRPSCATFRMPFFPTGCTFNSRSCIKVKKERHQSTFPSL